MDIQKIKELALANGFSLKEQASGNMDLHSYVYEFAQAIENEVLAQARSVFGQNPTIQKEREAFENWWEALHNGRQIACDYVEEDNSYSVGYANAQWVAWQAAKAQAVSEGFVLIPKDQVTIFLQDADEPENFVNSESDFISLGDCIDLGEIMEINKFTQAHVNKEILFGTWLAEAIEPSEKANFFVGTHAECLEIVAKNKAMIEAQEQGHE